MSFFLCSMFTFRNINYVLLRDYWLDRYIWLKWENKGHSLISIILSNYFLGLLSAWNTIQLNILFLLRESQYLSSKVILFVHHIHFRSHLDYYTLFPKVGKQYYWEKAFLFSYHFYLTIFRPYCFLSISMGFHHHKKLHSARSSVTNYSFFFVWH